MAEKRSRYWQFIGYPDSWPTYYEDLSSLKIPTVGILHNQDLKDDGSGELKKPHFHFIQEFDGPVSRAVFEDGLEGFPAVLGGYKEERVATFVGACRYLLHLDDPEKHQYSRDEVFYISGGRADFERELSKEETKAIRSEILRFVREWGFTEYSDLVDYCEDLRPEWSDDVQKHTVFWSRYLASARHKVSAE